FRQAVDLARAAAFERRGDLSATLAGLDRVGEAGWPLAGPFPDEAAGGADEARGNEALGNEALGNEDLGHEDLGHEAVGNEALGNDGTGDGRVAVPPATEHGDRLLLESLTLALALLLGDPGVAERAQRRMRVAHPAPRAGWEDPLRRALARWRAVLPDGHAPRASNGLPDASAGVVFRMLASHDPVSARVAFLVIGG
ncbi:MAG: hypothetical protein V3T22_11270, partial [Planctomycetota bacterium]